MRPIGEFSDQWGLLDKLYKPDGGDTCQREGMYWGLLGIMRNVDMKWTQRETTFQEVCKKLHPHPGVLLRHSNPDYDASDWDRMSRDQVQAMVIAMGYWDTKELKRFCKGHLKRGFLFCNNTRRNGATKRNHGQMVAGEVRDYSWKLPDITGPEVWGNIIRGFNAWYLWPLLLVCDIELFLGTCKWRWFRRHNIALNHTLSMMQAHDRLPTPLSWLAQKVMPIPEMIEICKDHLDDSLVEMPFFGNMFTDAWESIR